MTNYYTGIGARKTPENICQLMKSIASNLQKHEYVLRSGGAEGADSAFESGVDDVNMKEIYLPYKKFNNKTGILIDNNLILKQAEDIASIYHLNFKYLNESSKKFHIRNSFQVLGGDLKTPSDFVICWTQDGKISGGTGQAMRIAKDKNIRIYNLYHLNDRDLIFKRIETIRNDYENRKC